MNTFRSTATRDGLTVTAHRGDRSVLLAFDLSEALTADLAGFAVVATDPEQQKPRPLLNRLSFDTPITATTKPADRVFTSTVDAPLQKFRWIDYPKPARAGTYDYHVTARMFDRSAPAPNVLTDGPSVSIQVEVLPPTDLGFELGFTSGYVSSQAYASHFHNAPIAPPGTARARLDADVSTFEKRWAWLGGHARNLIYDVLNDVKASPSLTLDVLAYDLDEPNIVALLISLGSRLRLVLDNSAGHVAPSDAEPEVERRIRQAGGQVRRMRLGRFQHNKVLLIRQGNEVVKVLTGSTNFSIRGLYAQANNAEVFAHAQPCSLFSEAFELLWQGDGHTASFANSQLAGSSWLLDEEALPASTVTFAPHTDDTISLGEINDAIGEANDCVLFAVMDIRGGGGVLDQLRSISQRADLFSYGVSDSATGTTLHKPGSRRGIFVPSGFLKKQIPAPFQPFLVETAGGSGHTIHHKFVVIDFNTTDPVVFAGSSNLAAGGETLNGDNLLAIHDRSVVTTFAVEAVRLVDHYHFRASVKNATVKPLVLQGSKDAGPPWWQRHYDPSDLRSLDRRLFVR